jgi:gliding motility-associated lipoprotein GldD
MNNKLLLLFILALVMLFSSCGDDEFSPKPKGYFRIDLPNRSYQQYDKDCPFTFEYPKYARVVHDAERTASPCWLNFEFPRFGATIHLTYEELDNNAMNYIKTSWDMVQKHITKASAMNNDEVLDKEHNVYGLVFNIEGNAASPLQFYLTDSTRHFLRGALYFYAVPNKDSIQPVFDFVRSDILHMIQTFRWKANSPAVHVPPVTDLKLDKTK